MTSRFLLDTTLSRSDGKIQASTITWHEIRSGAARLPRGRGSTRGVRGDREIVRVCRRAVTGHVAKLTLVTANVRHFKRFKGVTILDWQSIATS